LFSFCFRFRFISIMFSFFVSAMTVYRVENRRQLLRSKIGAGFRPLVSSALEVGLLKFI